jgi:molybdate transport system ATP-binding protein
VTDLTLDLAAERGPFRLRVAESLPLTGVTALFGPSGAGKSTLLRAIAGFDRLPGRIAFGDEVWQDAAHFVPPHRRRVATVFQDARLFAHLTVRGNLAYAARRSGSAGRLAGVADQLALGPLLDRRTPDLSGGEAQRVALARALLSGPRLILMDEPLSALDNARRSEILPMIEALAADGQVPVIYVSHSLPEVVRLADRVLLIEAGRITGRGSVEEVFAAGGPADASGTPGNVIAATVTGIAADGLTIAGFPGGTLLSAEPAGPPGTRVRFLVRPRDVILSLHRPEGLSALNVLPATVTRVTEHGTAAEIGLMLGAPPPAAGTPLTASITLRSCRALGLAPGTACHAILKTVALGRD